MAKEPLHINDSKSNCDVIDRAQLVTNKNGLEIARGNINGYSAVNKFGLNENLNTSTFEDIWDGGGSYSYPADNTAPIVELSSTNAGDTEPIEIQGLDIDGYLCIQTITLTGTTPVIISLPLWRVFRMRNVGTSDLSGSVDLRATGGGTLYAQINNGNNQTLMALYTVPKGKTAFMVHGGANLHGLTTAYSIDSHFYIRQFGGVFQVKLTFALLSDGSGAFQKGFDPPLPIPALSDIRVESLSSKNGGGMSANFDLILIDD